MRDLDFVGEGGEGKHISLAAIFEGKHISLVICVRGHTYHGETHITVTPAFIFFFLRYGAYKIKKMRTRAPFP